MKTIKVSYLNCPCLCWWSKWLGDMFADLSGSSCGHAFSSRLVVLTPDLSPGCVWWAKQNNGDRYRAGEGLSLLKASIWALQLQSQHLNYHCWLRNIASTNRAVLQCAVYTVQVIMTWRSSPLLFSVHVKLWSWVIWWGPLLLFCSRGKTFNSGKDKYFSA